MDGVNLHASINNLSQMDRHQQEVHRTPVVNQNQNAELAQEELSRRLQMPVQPDNVEGKNVDPDARRRVFMRRRKKKKKGDREDTPRPKDGDTGFFIDCNA